jgi:phage shock protein A
MSILARVGRIAKANINWLLDKAEPPEQELQAKIAELTAAIQECKVAAATYGATFRKLQQEVGQLSASQSQLQSQAEQALRSGDEDTARRLLSQKLSITQRLTNLAPGVQQGREVFDRLRDNLARLGDQLIQARAKLAELRTRQVSAEARKAFSEQLDGVSGATAPAMFERMETQVIGAEAQAEVLEEIQGGDLEQRSRDLQIDAELESLRERLTDQSG